MRSTAGKPRASLAVVMTGTAPSALATSLASAFAPDTWPPRTLIANCPASSTTTTGGSRFLLRASGPRMRTTMPRAMMQTSGRPAQKRSCSVCCADDWMEMTSPRPSSPANRRPKVRPFGVRDTIASSFTWVDSGSTRLLVPDPSAGYLYRQHLLEIVQLFHHLLSAQWGFQASFPVWPVECADDEEVVIRPGGFSSAGDSGQECYELIPMGNQEIAA